MKNLSRPLRELQPADFSVYWLWQYAPSKDGNLWLKPVDIKKTNNFKNRMVACKVNFADGTDCWALIEGINLDIPMFSLHNRILYLFVFQYGWFELAQYFSSAAVKDESGDEVLCSLLGKRIRDVFPISFDLSDKATVDSSCLKGSFEHNPEWGLTQKEVMAILVRELSEKAK